MAGIIRLFGHFVGPATVIAAGTMGAGAVATLILAGAWFRYDLLWVVLFMLPLFVIAVDSSARIGVVNRGQGMLSIVRSHIHPSLAWLLLIINVPVHILVAMGQFSVMTSSFLALLGVYPPDAVATQSSIRNYQWLEIVLSLVFAVAILWLVLSRGYGRMQKAMTAMMILMCLCFFAIAVRSFSEIGDILAGFIPSIPADLPIPGRDTARLSQISIIAIVGTVIAPGALLGIPYMSSDARGDTLELREELRKSIINLGVVFGAYALFIIIAGGFTLYPLPDHAQIETVHQAGRVLTGALPEAIGFLGPVIFSLGLFVSALTTLVVIIQVISYISLDMANQPWAFTDDNRLFRKLMIVTTLSVAVLAPLWSFPALLKVILLMGLNILAVPVIIATMIYLLNRRQVMGEHTAEPWRNILLALGFVVSVALAAWKVPEYIHMLVG